MRPSQVIERPTEVIRRFQGMKKHVCSRLLPLNVALSRELLANRLLMWYCLTQLGFPRRGRHIGAGVNDWWR